MTRFFTLFVALVLFAGFGNPPLKAQEAGAPPAQAQPAAKGTGAARPAAKATGASTDGDLRQRVEQLEEQLVDMQVIMGTLESLARSGPVAQPAPRSGAGGGASDPARVDGMETQIRALTTQVEQLNEQIRQLGGTPRRSDGAPPSTSGYVAERQPTPRPQDGSVWSSESSFGQTTVTPDTKSSPGSPSRFPDSPPNGSPSEGVQARAPGGLEDLPPVAGAEAGGNPKELYEKAYGHLLQQNYVAAEQSFDEFLKRYPNDSLSGNAQYWLGESHFVRGQYKAAASAFLKGYETYAKSAKAPDSLLKLAMSLDRLGQKDAACSSYSELSSRFPNAAANVKTRAQSEKQRVGCP